MADELTGIWPDFIAPSKYEKPDPRWQDPGLPDFRMIWKIARECGYSIGLHGSMKRDCDMIAAPWTDQATSAEELIDRLCLGLGAFILGEPVRKPHGRMAWALQIRDAYKKAIDISVMPRDDAQRDRITALEDRARSLAEALGDIARQKKTDELDTEYDVECSDFEGGYDAIIDRARAAHAKHQKIMGGE